MVDDAGPQSCVIAYAMYLRTRGTAFLHKICVIEPYRGVGVGRQLMLHIVERLRKSRCRSIQLWVDDGRERARRLYKGCGFVQTDTVLGYYGSGRTGINMNLALADG